MENPRAALRPIFNALDKEIKADEIMQNMRSRYYRGMPTKKLLKALDLYREAGVLVDKFEESDLHKKLGLKD